MSNNKVPVALIDLDKQELIAFRPCVVSLKDEVDDPSYASFLIRCEQKNFQFSSENDDPLPANRASMAIVLLKPDMILTANGRTDSSGIWRPLKEAQIASLL